MKLKKNEKKFERLVVKFGGSSLIDGIYISRAANSVVKKAKTGSQIAVVVSAMGKTTDYLIYNIKKANDNVIPNDERDDILGMGERTSARVFASALKATPMVTAPPAEKPIKPILLGSTPSALACSRT